MAIKFSSKKEMEQYLKESTTIKDINNDIEVDLNGVKIYLDKIGNQLLNGKGTSYWLAKDDAKSVSLDFEIIEGNGTSNDDKINVSRVHFVG
jgi:hypothetical protein